MLGGVFNVARTSHTKEQNGMTTRAQKLINQTYGENLQPAIFALIEFASKNSGMNYADYGDPKSYRQEARSINQDWQRFKAALAIAATEGVTDQDVITEAPHAFSGRLEWVVTSYNDSKEICADCGVKPWKRHLESCNGGQHRIAGSWEYCTGQYFPTEYRKAAATLLEYATRKVRQARPAQKARVCSIADLKRLNEQNGGCWFDRGSMQFFNTKIESGILRGKYFVTSERFEDNPRKYTLRSFDETGSVDTVGEFHHHLTKQSAIDSIPAEQEQAA